MRYAAALLFVLLALTAGRANQVSCTESAFHAELARINSCTNEAVGTCSGTPGTCSNGGMACNVATQSTDCDCTISTGKTITFGCSNTTIKLRDDDLVDTNSCTTGGTVCVCGGVPGGGSFCTSDAQCSGGVKCQFNDHACHSAYNGGASTEPSAGYCSGDWKSTRQVQVDNVTIDGQTNNITFELDPKCNARTSGSVRFEQGASFIRTSRDGMKVKNLTIGYFYQGVDTNGADVDNTLVEGVTVPYVCDDAVRGAVGTGTGNVVKNLTITTHKNKAITLWGTPQQAVNWTLDNVNAGAVDLSGQAINIESGKHLIKNSTFGGGKHAKMRGGIATWENCTFQNSQRGLIVERSAVATIRGGLFSNNSRSGLSCCNNARCDVECASFIGNGGSTGPNEFCLNEQSGAATKETNATLDLGNGAYTSGGDNTFRSNATDIHSLGGTIIAEDNCFSTSSGNCSASPKVVGSVDTTPKLSTPPTGCSTITPPSTETVCQNQIDDDQDGATDCADSDCTGVGPCTSTETNCTDAIDNDGDELIDCSDSDCSGDSACPGGSSDLIIISRLRRADECPAACGE